MSVLNTLFVVALHGAGAVSQSQDQSQTVASVTEVAGANLPTATSLSQGLGSAEKRRGQPSLYYWRTTPAGQNAQLLTLFYRACDALESIGQEVPLLSVLRDTLGDQSAENDRVKALENFSQGVGLIPEQIWDGPDVPPYLRFGGSTDAAMPLLWAHSEYVKLHRSAADHRVFDLIEPEYERYVTGTGRCKALEVWKPNRQVPTVPAGALLRVQADSPFLLHWSSDGWQNSKDTRSQGTAIGIEFVDIPLPERQKTSFASLFYGWKKIGGKAGTTQ